MDILYYIDIIHEDNNIHFDYYKLGGKKYNFINNISFIANTENIRFELPVSLRTKYIIDNFIIHFYYIEIIDKDTFYCLNTIKYYQINYIQGKIIYI